jgi:3-hydroxybutyryl-CoA dehydrogenase
MTDVRRAAVIGGGLMGHGIAQVLAGAGLLVAVYEPDPGVLASVPERIRANLAALGLDTSPAGAIELYAELGPAARDAGVVIEAAPEDLPVKQELFAMLDALAAPDAILASNTSVISIGEIGARVRHRERVVGTHWWNPPYLVPLVEVVQAEHTSDATVERTMAFLTELGKTPVRVRKDVPGFVGNRLQHALWREAAALVDQGICDAETVDTVVKQSFGLRLPVLGPLENADLVGLDLTLAIHEHVLPFLDRTSGPAPILRAMVERGDLGMKTGRGFHRWTDETAQATRDRLLAHLAAVTRHAE